MHIEGIHNVKNVIHYLSAVSLYNISLHHLPDAWNGLSTFMNIKQQFEFVDIIRLVASYGCFEGERVLITEKKNHTIYHTKHHLLRNYSWSCHTNWSLLLTKSICFMEVLCAWMSANVHFVDIYWTKWKQTIDKLPVVILIYSAEARRDITIL